MLKIYSPIYFIIQILTVPRWRCVFLVLQREYVCMLVCVLCVLKKKKKKRQREKQKKKNYVELVLLSTFATRHCQQWRPH